MIIHYYLLDFLHHKIHSFYIFLSLNSIDVELPPNLINITHFLIIHVLINSTDYYFQMIH